MNKIVPLLVRNLLLTGCLAILNLSVAKSQNFTFQTWNTSNQSTFTVNAFRSVTIDKYGTVWGGSDFGGLYYYQDSIWTKATTYPDITFRHLVPSNVPGDSNVWATSIGKTGAQAISGGAYYINTKTKTITQYSAAFNNGGLSSRYGNSLAMSRNGYTYVALAQSITGTSTNQGGVYKIATANPPAPSNTSFIKAIPDAGDILYHSAGNRGDELWFGRGANCVNGCKEPYITRLSGQGDTLPRISSFNSPLPFTNTSTSPFARAIFTDSITGNTFVGLSTGGIGVYKLDNTWKMLTSSNSPFPVGAAVNFNAISEVYGEIWMGTTAGVFVYNGTGSLDSSSSFKLLTITDGLPSNNITDIAVDITRSEIWVTSGVGVSRAPYERPFINGIVYSVYCNRPESSPDSLKLYESLQKKPMTTGVKVLLLENGIAKDSSELDVNGVFELKKAQDNKLYTVEIIYKKGGKQILYKYLNIKNHEPIGAILIPDSLISEIQAFKPNMQKRCFSMKLQFSISLNIVCFEGFDVSNYDQSYEDFYSLNGIRDNHKKRVENLADFYTSIATVYNLGGTSNQLIDMAVVNAFDAIEALLKNVEFGVTAKEYGRLGLAYEKSVSFIETNLKLLQSGYLEELKNGTARNVSDPNTKIFIGKFYTLLSDAADFGIAILKEGRNKALVGAGIDAFKKAAATVIAAWYYKYYYCQTQHGRFLLNATTSSKNAYSNFLYDQTYNKLYNPISNSLVKLSNDTLELFKSKVDFYKSVAKVAEYAKTLADAVSAISAVIPGGQGVSVVFKSVAQVARYAKPAALTAAMIQGVNGGLKISILSDKILPQTGFTNSRVSNSYNRTWSSPSQQTPKLLLSRKNSYNLKLTELQNIYNSPSYDSATYFNRFYELLTEDSLYTDEMTKTLNALWASADSAVILVPGFSNKLGKVIDSFVAPQYHLRNSFFYQNIGYRFNPDKTTDVAELNSIANELIVLNDSAVNGITRLADDINSNGIAAPPYLVQEGYVLNYTRVPGSSGSMTYTFKNYGTQSQRNVSFKLTTDITTGYIFTGSDSVNVGTILPGEAKQVSFTFTSPITDSVCRYTINVNADNGNFRDVTGSLYVVDPSKYYSVKDGNWSDPATWSNNIIPNNANNVVISHKVTIDVDASCKSLKVIVPASIKINSGKNLNVQQ